MIEVGWTEVLTVPSLQAESVKESGGTPSVVIRYRKTEAKVSAAASKFHGASPEVLAAMEQMKPDLSFKVSLNFCPAPPEHKVNSELIIL